MISNKRSKDLRSQSGQALLLAMMLVATVLTVFLSISFKSTTETQVTKLEEESQKALAAAEAGIEAALKTTGEVTIGEGLSGDLSGFSGSAVCSETYDKTYFVSPLLQKDEQYTFYLAKYDSATHSFSDYYPNDITLYYGTQANCSDISLEITLLYANDAGTNSVTRWIADSSDMLGSNTNEVYSGSSGYDLGNAHFNCSTSAIDIPSVTTKPKLLIVRLFGGAGTTTQLGFSGLSALKPQGKICDANASSSTVTKKIYLLQSYPQIPAEFFVTSF